MSKRFPPGKCVHCLRDFESLTSDHLLPKAWLPKSIPENVERWQIPSCSECNKNYGKLEEDLLVAFSHCLDPKDPLYEGLYIKAKRSITPSAGKSEQDCEKRKNQRTRFLKKFIHSSQVPKSAFFPGFGLSEVPNSDWGLLIPEESLKKFGEKIIRGIIYITKRMYVDFSHEISVDFQHEENIKDLINLMETHGEIYEFGQAISIKVWYAENYLPCGVFDIFILRKVRMYGFVKNKSLVV
ncbi:MAG: hypothetical protein A2Z57_05060 [Planctomycetes bacterium RIFCSPHIGHO2_12_39_6]|nr:MAG: hypothetical protein A2Z57_05060 [Planctomycetes bacterium RIFCSPHIGHO2_12_39_6]